jgi:(R,R)-butanediol dehydrogenase/meso-butanediol dehydrogenase/diacetyl reductase
MGRVLSLGIGREPDAVVPLSAGMKGLSLQFPVGYSLKDFGFVAQTMLDGHIDPKIMISRVVPLAEFPAVFDRLLDHNTENKVQVAPG